jgi:hypothetical protein
VLSLKSIKSIEAVSNPLSIPDLRFRADFNTTGTIEKNKLTHQTEIALRSHALVRKLGA